jgi:hypothetical protein
MHTQLCIRDGFDDNVCLGISVLGLLLKLILGYAIKMKNVKRCTNERF